MMDVCIIKKRNFETMNRSEQICKLNDAATWDIIIIGGGATGAGAALDAASRGYKTLLIEQYDFAKGTSSKSTKLVHGGVRYLQQGNIKLVFEALRERGRLLKNAPHLTSTQAFIVPVYSLWEKIFYGVGLKVYDVLAGSLSLGKTKLLNKKQTIQQLPSINTNKLYGGVLYFDGQFDDSNLCIEILGTAAKKGATIINYFKAIGFIKDNDKITGLEIMDTYTQNIYKIHAKAVVNATGAFTNEVVEMDDKNQSDFVTPSQGIHFVINKNLFEGSTAMMIPKTDDGRVLFAVPWFGKVIVGTTDTPIEKSNIEPKALEEEIKFVLEHINRYGTQKITRADVNSIFVGLRPLISTKNKGNTSGVSREHALHISLSGLVSIIGGKWTTYRQMAIHAIDNAAFVGKLPTRNCVTANLPIDLSVEKKNIIKSIIESNPEYAHPIHADYHYQLAEIIYAVRHQMATNVEDILSRRIRLLYLDARLAMQVAPNIAMVLSKELNKDQNWIQQQVVAFNELASTYILD
jgi:glycerol-3-phosphate dehydrogenase